MAVLTPPRPDLLAYREATTLEFSKLVSGADGNPGEEIDGLHCFGERRKSGRALDRRLRAVQGS